ncbi:hypothetical protein MXD63_14750 [Frankia sp. Cpl3]|nr:hypothetical protein [Frankia sp. Cpl3]
MSTDTTTFAGLPIKGEVSRYTEPRGAQKTAEDFKKALDRLLGLPGVKAVVWHQYTPYFNDGDPCTFGIHLDGVALDPAPEGASSPYESIEDDKGNELSVYEVWDLRDAPTVADVHRALKALEGDLGSYEDVFLKAFGDPARVIARADGFTVEDYSHD